MSTKKWSDYTFDEFKQALAQQQTKYLGKWVYSDSYETYPVRGLEILDDEIRVTTLTTFTGKVETPTWSYKRSDFRGMAPAEEMPRKYPGESGLVFQYGTFDSVLFGV